MLAPNTTTITLDGATGGDVRITMGAGELALRGGAPAGTLMEATVFSVPLRNGSRSYAQSVNGSTKTVIHDRQGT